MSGRSGSGGVNKRSVSFLCEVIMFSLLMLMRWTVLAVAFKPSAGENGETEAPTKALAVCRGRSKVADDRREASQHAFQAAAEVVCADHLRVPGPVRTSAPLGAVVTRSWITAAGRLRTPPTFQGIKDLFLSSERLR